jgi:serine/threonine-protein kinase
MSEVVPHEWSGAVSHDQERSQLNISPSATPEPVPDADAIPQLARYCVLGLMARGGMSQIYRARDTLFDRDVALKFLAPELTHDLVRVERFRLEAKRVAALQHPNIVPMIEHGQENNRFYLVMPFYPGALREVLMARGPLPLAEVATIIIQIAAALDYAHSHGLIHRDVKPENILLDGEGRYLLTDFGISKSEPNAPQKLATSAPLTALEAGQMPIASIEYSSPEHLLGRTTDARSDEYALAVVAYELLTCHVPFRLETDRMYNMLMRMLTERPVPPSRLSPRPLAPEVDAVLLKALTTDPDRRYQTPGAFAEDLKRAARVSAELAPLAPDLPMPPPVPIPDSALNILPPDPEDLPRPTVADWRQYVPGAAQDIEDAWTQPLGAVSKKSRGRLGFLKRRRR